MDFINSKEYQDMLSERKQRWEEFFDTFNNDECYEEIEYGDDSTDTFDKIQYWIDTTYSPWSLTEQKLAQEALQENNDNSNTKKENSNITSSVDTTAYVLSSRNKSKNTKSSVNTSYKNRRWKQFTKMKKQKIHKPYKSTNETNEKNLENLNSVEQSNGNIIKHNLNDTISNEMRKIFGSAISTNSAENTQTVEQYVHKNKFTIADSNKSADNTQNFKQVIDKSQNKQIIVSKSHKALLIRTNTFMNIFKQSDDNLGNECSNKSLKIMDNIATNLKTPDIIHKSTVYNQQSCIYQQKHEPSMKKLTNSDSLNLKNKIKSKKREDFCNNKNINIQGKNSEEHLLNNRLFDLDHLDENKKTVIYNNENVCKMYNPSVVLEHSINALSGDECLDKQSERKEKNYFDNNSYIKKSITNKNNSSPRKINKFINSTFFSILDNSDDELVNKPDTNLKNCFAPKKFNNNNVHNDIENVCKMYNPSVVLELSNISNKEYISSVQINHNSSDELPNKMNISNLQKSKIQTNSSTPMKTTNNATFVSIFDESDEESSDELPNKMNNSNLQKSKIQTNSSTPMKTTNNATLVSILDESDEESSDELPNKMNNNNLQKSKIQSNTSTPMKTSNNATLVSILDESDEESSDELPNKMNNSNLQKSKIQTNSSTPMNTTNNATFVSILDESDEESRDKLPNKMNISNLQKSKIQINSSTPMKTTNNATLFSILDESDEESSDELPNKMNNSNLQKSKIQTNSNTPMKITNNATLVSIFDQSDEESSDELLNKMKTSNLQKSKIQTNSSTPKKIINVTNCNNDSTSNSSDEEFIDKLSKRKNIINFGNNSDVKKSVNNETNVKSRKINNFSNVSVIDYSNEETSNNKIAIKTNQPLTRLKNKNLHKFLFSFETSTPKDVTSKKYKLNLQKSSKRSAVNNYLFQSTSDTSDDEIMQQTPNKKFKSNIENDKNILQDTNIQKPTSSAVNDKTVFFSKLGLEAEDKYNKTGIYNNDKRENSFKNKIVYKSLTSDKINTSKQILNSSNNEENTQQLKITNSDKINTNANKDNINNSIPKKFFSSSESDSKKKPFSHEKKKVDESDSKNKILYKETLKKRKKYNFKNLFQSEQDNSISKDSDNLKSNTNKLQDKFNTPRKNRQIELQKSVSKCTFKFSSDSDSDNDLSVQKNKSQKSINTKNRANECSVSSLNHARSFSVRQGFCIFDLSDDE